MPYPDTSYPGMPHPGMAQPPPNLADPDQFEYWGPDDPEKNRKYYEQTSVTPHVEIGYEYPGITNDDLRELDHADQMCGRFVYTWEPVSLSEATVGIVESLRKPRSDRAERAIKRLRDAWSGKWSPDIAIKSFFDLDKAFFGGKLRGRVRLRWTGSTNKLLEEFGPDNQHMMGCTGFEQHTPVAQARIFLNAEKLFLIGQPERVSSKQQTFGTLVHEMIHAYLITRCCVGSSPSEQFDPDPGHGRHFQRLAKAMDRRTMADLGFEVFWAEKDRRGR
ncbi:hypothetical protein MMC30_003209 [Trapelia coarctata]|nr:hypothetical protein [Trapelia coarctata]